MSFFYNREDELNRLLALAKGLPQGKIENLALIGVRKIGKTLILFRLDEMLRSHEHVLFCYTYVEPGSFRDFALAALLSLLTRTALHFQALDQTALLGLNREEKLRSLAQALLPLFPRLGSKWLDLPSLVTKEAEVTFDLLFELAERLGQERDIYYLLALDEFQNVRSFGYPAFEHRLRQHLLHQRRFGLIVAGSSISAIEDMFRNRKNPLFGHFKIELVQPFPFPVARGFIIEKLAGKLLLNETQLAFLAQTTGGYPYYLDVLTDEILRRAPALRRASESVITEALLSTTFASNGPIYTYLAYLIEASFQARGYKTYLNLLKAIALGKHSVSEIARALRLKKENVSTPLRRLVDMGFLYRAKARYFFLDPLLELWIREVYSLEEDLTILGLHERYDFFKSQVERMIAAFKTELGKGNEARIRELFAAFDGRTSLRGLRLPHFDSVAAEVIDGKQYDIVARREGRVWIAEVKDRPVDAGMAKRFLEKLRSLVTCPVEQKILICLAGYDSRVPALAEEEELHLWGLEDVNLLMRTYGRYPINL